MQILQLTFAEFDLYNCVTGEQISSYEEGINFDAVSLVATWEGYENVKELKMIKEKTLQKAWDDLLLKVESRGDPDLTRDELMQFLNDYDNPNWIVYEICPDEIPVWFVIDVTPPI